MSRRHKGAVYAVRAGRVPGVYLSWYVYFTGYATPLWRSLSRSRSPGPSVNNRCAASLVPSTKGFGH
jgi:hypothetical protein